MAATTLSPLLLPRAELDELPETPLHLPSEGYPRSPGLGHSPSTDSVKGGWSPLLLSRGGSTPSHHRRRLALSPDGTGSALETFSALLLHQETHGQAAVLSRQREGASTSAALQEAITRPARMLKKLRRHSLPLGVTDARLIRVGTEKGHPTFEVQSPPFPMPRQAEEGFGSPVDVSGSGNGMLDGPCPAHSRSGFTTLPTPGTLSDLSVPGAWVENPAVKPSLPAFDWGGNFASTDLRTHAPHTGDSRKPEAFDSILGVHRARARQVEARKEERRHQARDRPMHQVSMFTAISNFVHAAHAADMAAKAGEKERKRHGQAIQSHNSPGPRCSLKRTQSHGNTPHIPAPEAQATRSSEFEAISLKSTPTRQRDSRSIFRDHGLVQDDTVLNPQQVLGLSKEDIEIQLRPGTTNWSSSGPNDDLSATKPVLSFEISGRTFWRWYAFGDLTIPRPSWQYLWTQLPTGAQVVLKALLMLFLPTGAVTWLVVVHTFGLTIFIVAHALALVLQVWEQLYLASWFLRWIFANLRGKTALSRCVMEAHRLILKEWSSVVEEDHEASEHKQTPRRGLSTFNIVRGLLELSCIQDATWSRVLEHDEGLLLLTKRSSSSDSNGLEGAQSWEDELNDDMVVTLQDNDIMQLTRAPRLDPVLEGSRGGNLGELPNRGIWSPTTNTPALIRTLRWAAGLAISAYGMHVPVAGLPPPFTPSGFQLRRQAFAHLSRLKAEAVLHADIQTLDDGATYCPTFYVVKDTARQSIVVAIRGTQSFRDIIVDLDMNASTLSLPPSSLFTEDEAYICHTGILRAAQTLIDPSSKLMRILRSQLEAEPTYSLVLTGHSLGGAIGSAIAVLLADFVFQHGMAEAGQWVTSSSCGLPSQRRIRVISFAHPATMSPNLATRAAMGSPPLVVSATLGPDIIPRCGHGQARELRRVLGALSRLRSIPDLALTSQTVPPATQATNVKRVPIFRTWIKWNWAQRRLRRAREEDKPSIRAGLNALEKSLWDVRCAVETDLYASVKSRRASRLKSNAPPSPWLGSQPSLHEMSARRHALDQMTLRNEEHIAGVGAPMLIPAGWNVWMSHTSSHRGSLSSAQAQAKTPLDLYYVRSSASFFSLPWLHPKLFTTHFPSAYESAIIDNLTY